MKHAEVFEANPDIDPDRLGLSLEALGKTPCGTDCKEALGTAIMIARQEEDRRPREQIARVVGVCVPAHCVVITCPQMPPEVKKTLIH